MEETLILYALMAIRHRVLPPFTSLGGCIAMVPSMTIKDCFDAGAQGPCYCKKHVLPAALVKDGFEARFFGAYRDGGGGAAAVEARRPTFWR